MPIVDALIVVEDADAVPEGAAKALAEALAPVFSAPPGTVWVKLHPVPKSWYAENGRTTSPCPVFLTILLADHPAPSVLAAQAVAITQAASACLGRSPEHVHVEYSAPGRGRVAFGGHLLR